MDTTKDILTCVLPGLVNHTNNKIVQLQRILLPKYIRVVIKTLIRYAVVSNCSQSFQCYVNENER